MIELETQLSEEQSRHVAALVREEIARRRISRQHLADKAKISISTLEKALGGRRPFTLATIVRLEEALGLSLRKPNGDAASAHTSNGDVAPDIDSRHAIAASFGCVGARPAGTQRHLPLRRPSAQ